MQAEFSHEIAVPLAPEAAFALFTPRGEEQWVPGWRPDYVWPQSGETARDMVFRTGSGEEATLWTCLAWQPEARHVRYLRATPASRVAFVDVRCRPDGTGGTVARIAYRYVALSDTGREFIGAISPESFAAMIDEWAVLIGRWLEGHAAGAPHHSAA